MFSDMGSGGRGTLHRDVGLVAGVGLVIGEIIGSGIFITPKDILTKSGSVGLVLIMWVIGAIIALFGALCYSELGTMIRKAGAEYAYILEAYSFKKKSPWLELLGSTLAFLFTWMSIVISRAAAIAIVTLTFGRYLSRPFFIDCEIPRGVDVVLALSALLLLLILNCVSVRWTARVMTALSMMKVLAGAFVIILGIVQLSKTRCVPSDIKAPFQGTTQSPGNIALAMYSVLWAYGGWNSLSSVNEEIKNPNKNIPRSLMIGLAIVTVVYLLVNVSLFLSLSYDEIRSAETVALVLAYKVIGRAGLVIVPLFVAASTLGTANANLFIGARVVFSAARDGSIPAMFCGVHNKFKTPMPALILQSLIAALMIVIGEIQFLIDGLSAAQWVFYCLTFVGLLIMRITHRTTPRPYKVWVFIPVVMVLVSVFLIVLPLTQLPVPSVASFGLILVGLPVFIFFVMETPWRIRPKMFDRISDYLSSYTNKLLNTTSSRNITG